MSYLSRRRFLKLSATAAGGMMLQWRLPMAVASEDAHNLGPFIEVLPDGTVVIGARNPEIGQGVKTSLPMIIAEELDVAWDSVRARQLEYGYYLKDGEAAFRYGGQGAGGSTSIPEAWQDLRLAGATARHQLRRAAAADWGVAIDQIATREGLLLGPGDHRAPYAQFVTRASELPPPGEGEVKLKTPDQYRIVGRPARVVDAADIVTGRGNYGIDQISDRVPVAMLVRSPVPDGKVDNLDDTAARAIPGIRHIVRIDGPAPDGPFGGQLAAGVAVIADDTWTALKARRALKITWSDSRFDDVSSQRLQDEAQPLLARDPEHMAREGGEKPADLALVEATYQSPFLNHATLEPQNAYLELYPDRAVLRASLQSPGGASRMIAGLTGLPREAIHIEMMRAGGGFGRRLENDFVAEAVLIAQAAKVSAIKLLWTREDDTHHDFFRPFGMHKMRGGIDAQGRVRSWEHHLVGTSRTFRAPGFESAPKWVGTLDGDGFPAEHVDHYRVGMTEITAGLPMGWWRGPVHTFAAFPIQSFVDELAASAGADPLEFRRRWIGEPRQYAYDGHGTDIYDTGRLLAVLERAASAVGWGRSLPDGHGLGIACHMTFGGYTAHAIEASVVDGRPRVHRMVCATDVGRVINPLGLEAQMMGGSIDGLSTALGLEITLDNGRVVQSNFDTYPLLRMADSPMEVEVHLIDSELDPVGAGEMAIPTVAPALCNALFAATGKRIRRLPIGDQLA